MCVLLFHSVCRRVECLYERDCSSDIDVDSDWLFICILITSDSKDIKNKESRRFI